MSTATMNPIADVMDMSYIPPQKVTICSIYPGKILPVKRPLYSKTYEVPSGTPENPGYLVVEDAFQQVYFGENIGSRLARELASRVAADIINEVSGKLSDSSAQEDAYPGIFVCAGDQATPDEIAENAARRHRFLKRQVGTAQELGRLKLNHRIDEKHRLAARLLDIHGEDWQDENDSGPMIACPWCVKRIPAQAKVCHFCSNYTKDEYRIEAQGPVLPTQSAPVQAAAPHPLTEEANTPVDKLPKRAALTPPIAKP